MYFLKKVDTERKVNDVPITHRKAAQGFRGSDTVAFKEGYGSDRIARILPVAHSTISRWIAILAREKGKVAMGKDEGGKNRNRGLS